ncbi:MAG: gfo/Idh/MocA family oxidoreductase, partial [Planctomycetota bacterium]|nr:gfo/Idh/MocA family oxidoreductase [Planctomycetota bacterium]
RGQRGAMWPMPGASGDYRGDMNPLPDLERPPLPEAVDPGHHGGSSGHLMNEFITAILEDRRPLVDIVQALNMTVAGIVAHTSAMRGGETLKVPQYTRA